jgi:hypothetical protein
MLACNRVIAGKYHSLGMSPYGKNLTLLSVSNKDFTHRLDRTVTPCVTETIIKSLKLQLSLKARANQVVEVGNQNSKSGVKIQSFKFGLVWTD